MRRLRFLFKVFGALVGLLVLAIGVALIIYYSPDRSLEELRDKWSYDNSKFVDIDGMPVHYRINGEGVPLVLIHGTAASVHTWETWTEELQDDFKVISLDMPAFGLTGPNNDGVYSLDFYAEFLDKFLNKIEVDSFHIAGNSLGGAIAWKYTSMYPQKIRKLVLIDASGYPSNKESPLAFKLAKSKLWQQLLLNFTPKSLFRASIEDVYYNDSLVTDQLIDRYYNLYLRPGNRQAFIDRVNNKVGTDPSVIKTIGVPTLIMWGKQDEWISVENAYRFKDDIQGSQLVIYDQAGHVPMEEIPLKSVTDCKAFLLSPIDTTHSF